MKKYSLFIIAGFILLAACSGSDDIAAKNQSDTDVENKTDVATKHDALLGFKRSLDTATSVMSAAEENEKKKQQMLQDIQ